MRRPLPPPQRPKRVAVSPPPGADQPMVAETSDEPDGHRAPAEGRDPEREEREFPAQESTAVLLDDLVPVGSRSVWRAARARRKVLKSEIRRFTQRSRRRRNAWLIGAAAVTLFVGGSLAVAYSPLFAVQRIVVVGASAIDPNEIAQALDDQIGTPLARIDSAKVRADLLAFPLIESYALEARPPHELAVRIVERTPVGVVPSGEGYTLVDAAGVALSTTPDVPPGQPVLTVERTTGDVFESLGLVIRSLPEDIRGRLTAASAVTRDDVALTLDGRITVLWGTSDESGLKARALALALAQHPDAQNFDISSTGAIVAG